MKPNWPQGGGKGYPKINNNMKKYRKRKRKEPPKTRTYFLKCAAIPSKVGRLCGSTFTVVFWTTKMIKGCIKNGIRKNRTDENWANLHRKNNLLETTRSQRHGKRQQIASSYACFRHFGALGRFGVPFWLPLDVQGVPRSIVFWTNLKNLIERRSKIPKWEAWNCKKEVFALYLL